MSMHTQLMRGLFALPVAALLLVAALVAPAATATPDSKTASAAEECEVPTRVDFHSMLPGALHIVRVKVAKG
jgi:ABC-type glycerol-3-phosphate transport system substrate-binding protein